HLCSQGLWAVECEDVPVVFDGAPRHLASGRPRGSHRPGPAVAANRAADRRGDLGSWRALCASQKLCSAAVLARKKQHERPTLVCGPQDFVGQTKDDTLNSALG